MNLGKGRLLSDNSYDLTVTGGKYVFNNVVKNNSLNLFNKTYLKLGAVQQIDPNLDNLDWVDGMFDSNGNAVGSFAPLYDSNTTYGVLNIDSLTTDVSANGSVIDMENNNICNANISNLTLNSDLNLKLDVDLQNKTTDTITSSVLNPNGHNLVIDSIYLMTSASGDTVEVTLTNDSKFKDVYKLSDDIIDNITKASGVKSYIVSYSNFGKWEDGTISGFDANRGILFFERTNDTLAVTVSSRGNIKDYEVPDTNEEVERDCGPLSGKVLTITGNGYEIHGNNFAGITLGSNSPQSVNVLNVSEFSGFSSPALSNKTNGSVNINNGIFKNNTGADIDNSGLLNLNGTNSFERIVDTLNSGKTEVLTGTTTVSGEMKQHELNVKSGASLVNNGVLTVNSGRNSGDISTTSGIAKMIVDGSFTNDSAHTIAQNELQITSNSTESSSFTNNGIVNVTTFSNSGYSSNLGSITAQNVKNAGFLSTNIGDIEITSATKNIDNAGGTLNLSGAGDIAYSVTGGNVVTSDNINFKGTNKLDSTNINLKSGTLSFEKDNLLAANVGLAVDGGALNFANDETSNINLGNLVLHNDLEISIDANINGTPSADVINSSNNVNVDSKSVVLKNIKLASDANVQTMPINGLLVAGENLKNIVKLGDSLSLDMSIASADVSGKSYIVTYNKSTGTIDFNFQDLPFAVKSAADDKTYTLVKNETISENLGNMNGSELKINGNGGKTIVANGSEGITVGSGKVLKLTDVGNYSGFSIGITNNGGTVEIKDTIFSGNTTDINNQSGDLIVKQGSSENGSEVSNITGNGNLLVEGKLKNNGNISQNTISVAITGTLITDASKISTSGNTIDNSGTLKFVSGDNNNVITKSAGTNSVVEFSGNSKNNAAITQDNIILTNTANVVNDALITGNIENSGVLESAADNLSGNITNNKTLNLTGGDNANNIQGNGTTTFNGTTTNTGLVRNVIVNNGVLTSDAGLLKSSSGVLENNNKLNLSGANTNNIVNSNNDSNSGEIVFNGNAINSGNITQQSISVLPSVSLNNTGIVKVKDFTSEGELINGAIISVDDKFLNKTGATLTNTGLINGRFENESGAEASTILSGITGPITNNGDLYFTNSGSTSVDISGSGVTHIQGAGTTVLNNDLGNNILSLDNGILQFGANKSLLGLNVANNSNLKTISSADGIINSVNLGDVNLDGTTNLVIDFNLSDLTSDVIKATSWNGTGKINISNVNVQGIPLQDSIRVYLGDTTGIDSNYLSSSNVVLSDFLTPIRRLHGKIEDSYLCYYSSGRGVNDFNPAVFVAPTATSIGGFLTQSQVLQDSFYHSDNYFKYSQRQRISSENRNKFAINDINTPAYIGSNLPETSHGMWVRPYTSFEKVNLEGGLSVSNIGYGMLYGGDSNLYSLANGFKGVISAFIGYNGSRQSYDTIDINQQGATLGLTGSLYKGNFFTVLTLSTGASIGTGHTMYGTDNFSMLTAGVASKTGYNFELADGKLILQPQLYLGYTFVNTFDYTNAAGVKVNSDPLNAVQVAPGFKIIGNLENGWKPYASVDMMLSFLGKTHVMANDSRLPNLSVKPYVQYGVGIQKSWGDRFTAFFQSMFRNGGRTGVVFQCGFRWMLGANPSKPSSEEVNVNNNSVNRKVIKTL